MASNATVVICKTLTVLVDTCGCRGNKYSLSTQRYFYACQKYDRREIHVSDCSAAKQTCVI